MSRAVFKLTSKKSARRAATLAWLEQTASNHEPAALALKQGKGAELVLLVKFVRDAREGKNPHATGIAGSRKGALLEAARRLLPLAPVLSCHAQGCYGAGGMCNAAGCLPMGAVCVAWDTRSWESLWVHGRMSPQEAYRHACLLTAYLPPCLPACLPAHCIPAGMPTSALSYHPNAGEEMINILVRTCKALAVAQQNRRYILDAGALDLLLDALCSGQAELSLLALQVQCCAISMARSMQASLALIEAFVLADADMHQPAVNFGQLQFAYATELANRLQVPCSYLQPYVSGASCRR